jgi:hypothetical protein
MSHETHGSPSGEAFSSTEWQQIQAEDRAGAKAVTLLLVGIFSIGLLLYSFVAATL